MTATIAIDTIKQATMHARTPELQNEGPRSHSSLMILVRSLFVASGKSPCTPSFIARVKNMNAVVGFRTLGRGGFLIAA